MENLVLRHPAIFGEYRKGSRDFDDFGVRRRGNAVIDGWGCEWSFLTDGLQGQVTKHPLEDWAALKTFRPPDPVVSDSLIREGEPLLPNSFSKAISDVVEAKSKGKLAVGDCSHGFMFQRLYYLRGFNNLMTDFILEPPELSSLIAFVVGYNMKVIHRWLDVAVDVLSFGDDLGTQDRLPIHPATFQRHMIPAYSVMFAPARDKGVHVRLHSDGHVMEVAEDLVKAGVTILNLQDLVNGVGEIRRRLKGRVCVDVDIDRQKILPFGTPDEVKRHVRKVVSELNSPDGGFMVTVDTYPPTPLENIEALCQALEEVGGGVKL